MNLMDVGKYNERRLYIVLNI